MSRESKILFGILAAVVVAMIGLFMVFNNSDNTNQPVSNKQALVRDNSHKLGEGKVQVVEFGDYQCPACGQAYPATKKIIDEYQGKITFIFRNYPLPMHKNAEAGAEAAEAAGALGKFWEMHDKLYETQNEWSEVVAPSENFAGYAKALGLDGEKIKSAVQNKQYANIINQDKSDGDQLGVQGTPTFYVNGSQVTIQTDYYQSLKAAIDNALK